MDRSDDGVTLFVLHVKQIMGEKIAAGYICRLETKRGQNNFEITFCVVLNLLISRLMCKW